MSEAGAGHEYAGQGNGYDCAEMAHVHALCCDQVGPIPAGKPEQSAAQPKVAEMTANCNSEKTAGGFCLARAISR
jgi:hypothetical protein